MKRLVTLGFLLMNATWLAVACGDSGDGEDVIIGSGGGDTGLGGSDGSGTAGDGATNNDTGGSANGTAGSNGTAAAGGTPDIDPPPLDCGSFGDSCDVGGDCCSGLCDPTDGSCAGSVGKCSAPGAPCGSNTECCTLNCDNDLCQDDACVADGEACTPGGDSCCSGLCVDGECGDINGGSSSCSSAGNPCDNDGDCCSKLCGEDGHCVLGSSFCVQKFDICSRNEQCCTGICEMADGNDVGYCGAAPDVPSSCGSGGIAGTVCNDCGTCCSRSCAPYGPTGVFICQLPSGCRLNGELCRGDSDCCGGDPDADLPGAGNGECVVDEGNPVGRCGNGNSCTPQGDVCHYKDSACEDSSTSAPNNCCSYLGSKSNCALDTVFVPRCDAIGDCREAGEDCASSGDCCDGVPCIRNDEGRLVCAEEECISAGGSCTTTADCCVGTECILVPGESAGVCGVTDEPPGGTGGAGSGSGGAPGTGGNAPTPCAEYGQDCGGGVECCNSDVVPCDNGVCRINPQ
jgi:hypothetical protein